MTLTLSPLVSHFVSFCGGGEKDRMGGLERAGSLEKRPSGWVCSAQTWGRVSDSQTRDYQRQLLPCSPVSWYQAQCLTQELNQDLSSGWMNNHCIQFLQKLAVSCQQVVVAVQLLNLVWFCMDCSMPGFTVLHHLPEFAQAHVHWVDDAIQSSHPLSPSSPFALSLSRNQGLFQWVDSLHHESESVSRSVVSDSLETPWTITRQAPLSMGFSRQGKWAAIAFSRGYSWPRDRTQISWIAGRFLTIWATREVNIKINFCALPDRYLPNVYHPGDNKNIDKCVNFLHTNTRGEAYLPKINNSSG